MQKTGGIGAAFVLIHGIGTSARYFRPLAQELSKYGTVYALDMPGFGKAPKPSRQLSISDYAQIILDFMAHENIARPILIGHSMGCQVIVETLHMMPNLTDRSVLIGPVVNDKERTTFKQCMRLLQNGLHEPLAVNMMIQMDYVRCGVRWYFTEIPHMLNYPIEDYLPDIQTELIIIRGENDVIVPRNWVKRLVARAPQAKFIELANAGHVAMYRYPREVAQLCRAKWEDV